MQPEACAAGPHYALPVFHIVQDTLFIRVVQFLEGSFNYRGVFGLGLSPCLIFSDAPLLGVAADRRPWRWNFNMSPELFIAKQPKR